MSWAPVTENKRDERWRWEGEGGRGAREGALEVEVGGNGAQADPGGGTRDPTGGVAGDDGAMGIGPLDASCDAGRSNSGVCGEARWRRSWRRK